MFRPLLIAICVTQMLAAADDTQLVLVLLKTGDTQDLSEAVTREAMAGHFSNMGRLAEEGILLLAGPLGPPRSDPGHRGIFVFNTADMDVALKHAQTDPGVKAGVFKFTLHEFRTADPLRDLPELEKLAQRKREADPNIPDEWQGRAYRLASSVNLPSEAINHEKVLFQGQLNGFGPQGEDVWLVALDAESDEAAKACLAGTGDWTVHGWYGTKALEQLGSHRGD